MGSQITGTTDGSLICTSECTRGLSSIPCDGVGPTPTIIESFACGVFSVQSL